MGGGGGQYVCVCVHNVVHSTQPRWPVPAWAFPLWSPLPTHSLASSMSLYTCQQLGKSLLTWHKIALSSPTLLPFSAYSCLLHYALFSSKHLFLLTKLRIISLLPDFLTKKECKLPSTPISVNRHLFPVLFCSTLFALFLWHKNKTHPNVFLMDGWTWNPPTQKFSGTLGDPTAVSQPWLHISITGSLLKKYNTWAPPRPTE